MQVQALQKAYNQTVLLKKEENLEEYRVPLKLPISDVPLYMKM
jgi:hypothetical protein